MTRKLVTVRPIKELVPIAGADRIELAIVDGWQVVVKRGIHQAGELVLYYEIDSFLPAEDKRYAFLDAPEASGKGFITWGDKYGARLKTIKLRKQLSQGLVLPLADFPEVLEVLADTTEEEKINLDVTELLKVEKWEPIEKEFRGNSPGSSEGKRFPAFIRKTDQERIQNYGTLVERALDEEFEVTIKKDGSSLTVFAVQPESPFYADAKALTDKKLSLWQRFLGLFKKKQAVMGICSRNVLLPLEGDSNFHLVVEQQGLLGVLGMIGMIGGSYALQGELVAPDIQGNYEKVTGLEFHLFDIFDIDSQKYLTPFERQAIAEDLCIPHCTILKQDMLRDIIGYKEGDDVVKKCLEYASGPGDNPGVLREGVVFKALDRDFSFKSVSNEYLLATGK
jgi:RNA ligase (TIGR02306 family)